MQVSVEELDGLERRVTVQVPAERIDKEVQSRLVSLSRNIKLDGFRPGKVPLKVVKRMYGSQVRQEVVGDVLQSSFQDALAQQNLHPAGGPTIEPKSIEEGRDLEYSATFEVFPEFELAGIEGLEVERPAAEVTDADIDKMLETLRKQRTVWTDVERGARSGDRVTVDFEGKIDGEDFSGNRGEGAPVVLGGGGVVKDFEDGLMGLTAGSDSEFDVMFPENYNLKELAGKVAHFKVKVKAVAEPSLPEIDADFALGFGIAEGGVGALRKAIRENLERELREGIRASLKRQIMQGLLDTNDVALPQAMIKAEIERLARQANFPASPGGAQETVDAKTAVFEQEARRRVALGLIISRLVAANGLKLDEVRVRAHLESIASTYEDAEEVIQWYYKNPKALEGIRALALEDEVVDWVLERARVIDKTTTFDAVMRPDKAQDAPS